MGKMITKRLSLFVVLVFLCTLSSVAQKKVYNEKADAQKELNVAIKKAKGENKNVFVKIGGNWCPWCIMFHNYTKENKRVHKVLKNNYIEVLVSARENKELMKKLGNPGRFGYPVFVILNKKGKVIHIQDSGLLEKGRGYDEKKVIRFLKNWSPKATRYTL